MKKMFWLEEGLQYSTEEIGNKAFLLAKLKNENVNVPKTFIISDQVFKEFLVHNKLLGKIYLNLYDIVKSKYNVSYSEGYLIAELQNKLNVIQKMVYNGKFDEDVGNDIKYFYESMNSKKNTNDLLDNPNNSIEVALKLSVNDQRSSKELGYVNYIDINSLSSLYLHIRACFAEFFTTTFFVNMMKKYNFIDLFKKEVRVNEIQFKNKFIELIEQVKYNILIQEKRNATKSGFLITSMSKKVYDNSFYLINDGDFTKNFSDHYSKLYKTENLDVAPMQYYLVNINNSIIFGNYGYNLTSSEIRETLKNKHRLLENIHSDRYLIDNNSLEVIYRDIRRQEKKVVFIESRFDTEAVEINSQNDQKINDKELLEVSRINKKLEGIYLVDYLFENNMLYVLNVDILEDLAGKTEGNIKDLTKKKIEEIFDTNTINQNHVNQSFNNQNSMNYNSIESDMNKFFEKKDLNSASNISQNSINMNNSDINEVSFDLNSLNNNDSQINQKIDNDFGLDINNSLESNNNNDFGLSFSNEAQLKNNNFETNNNLIDEENYTKTLNELYTQETGKIQNNGLDKLENDSIFSINSNNNFVEKKVDNNEFIFNENIFNELNSELNNKQEIINENFRETINQDTGIGQEIKKYLDVHTDDFSEMDDRSLDGLINNNLKEILMYVYLKKSKSNPQVKDKILKNIVDNYDNLKSDKKKLLDYLKVFFN